MNPIEMMKQVPTIISRSGGRSVLMLKKYSPEILVGLGIGGVVASAVMACKATKKVEEVTVEHKNEIALLETSLGVYHDEEANKALLKARVGLMLDYIKLYAPSMLLGTASIACIVGSHGILKKRNVALAAAYSVVEGHFKEYRQRVVNEFGEEKDKQLYFGTQEDTVEFEEVDDKGKTKKVKKKVQTCVPGGFSQYAKCFDEGNVNWVGNAEYNQIFLRNQQNFMNDLLRTRGHVLLNDVYDALGFPRTKEGCVVGWTLNKDGDNFIDFGMYNAYNPFAKDFINGYENSIWLDFNVDGLVFEEI